jgi:winged helix DNA-binding protein
VRDPADVARAIGGAQAQDTYAGPLTFRSRSRRLTAADVERARTEERSLLRTWVMRMTIHLIPTDDAGWMLPLFEPAIERWSRRRLEQLGMPSRMQEKALGVVKRTLDREGPLTRPEVAENIVESGVELNSSTRLHIIGLAVTSGIACLGPDKGKTTCLVLRQDWLGKLPRFDREAALAELARRYLGAFAPATERDFAKWSSLPLRDLRVGLERIESELVEARLGDETAFSLRRRGNRSPSGGSLRMLGAFDTYMLGYANRDFALPAKHASDYKAGGGGWLRPVIVRDGVVIGGWSYRRKGKGVEVRLTSPEALSGADRKEVDAELADIARFEDAPVKLVDDRPG